MVLLPFIVPTALSAIAFWWIYDAQFSVISWVLMRMGWIHSYIDFLGDPWMARMSTIIANIWRGVPSSRSACSPGLQTIPPSLYEATIDRRRQAVAAVLVRDAAAPDPDYRGGDDVLGAVHLHRLPADLRVTRGGPLNATHLMATLSFQRGSRRRPGEGAAMAAAMIPFLLSATLFSYFGLQRRAWQQGGGDK